MKDSSGEAWGDLLCLRIASFYMHPYVGPAPARFWALQPSGFMSNDMLLGRPGGRSKVVSVCTTHSVSDSTDWQLSDGIHPNNCIQEHARCERSGSRTSTSPAKRELFGARCRHATCVNGMEVGRCASTETSIAFSYSSIVVPYDEDLNIFKLPEKPGHT